MTIWKNKEAGGKQKKEYVKEKKVYNKAASTEDKSGDEFGKEIGIEEMVRAVKMCKEVEKGCDRFSLYLDNYKEEVVGRQGIWRGARVMETYDEWGARRGNEKVEAKRERREVEKNLVSGDGEQEPSVKRNPSSGPLDNFLPGPAPGTRRIWCYECDKYLYGSPYHLQKHKDTVHFGLRPWECPGCDSKFGIKSNIRHKDFRPFVRLSRSDHPSWIRKRAGLESSGRIASSYYWKTKRKAFFFIQIFFVEKKGFFWCDDRWTSLCLI